MESSMRLTSSAFADGAMIPRRFTCDCQDLSPPLAWADVPNNVRSFVLLCDDPDAPGGTWHHWAVYDIPVIPHNLVRRGRLAEGAPGRGIEDH
jgi:Raf kinase inhibitor-like YbhB/YbcL family protein